MPNTTKTIADVYEIVQNPMNDEDDHWCVLIKETQFSGLLYKYNEVSFGPENHAHMTLRFTYDVLDIPPSLQGNELNEQEEADFKTLLGDVLVDIIENDFDRSEEEVDNGSRRVSYTEKSDTERVLYKKSNSVSQV